MSDGFGRAVVLFLAVAGFGARSGSVPGIAA